MSVKVHSLIGKRDKHLMYTHAISVLRVCSQGFPPALLCLDDLNVFYGD